ncbi:pyrroloquinoline quinone precursor peptide PqqA [Parazoarcus communis]|uniref:Coenzyme PQQ synthesis protein A n=1 Tax=Parazoarcus communis TaxID=41977 RepID=A0A2U8GP51_9RHOO|nr:pyrroloquinoline quinone precursor peptide PqqA [Parazoarcus communis]
MRRMRRRRHTGAVSGHPERHVALPTNRRHVMKWETPAACDFRFGFEITMYIATR